MLFKKFLLYLCGYYEIEIEGLFIQRFMNLAASKKITIISSKIEKSTVLSCRILKKNIEEIKCIAEKAGCLITIKKENGVPYVLNKYKKRKGFAVTTLVIAFFIYLNSLFIWNIDIKVNSNILNNEEENNLSENILVFLGENDIKIGEFKSKITEKKDELINKIRLEFDGISWIGIEVKGTNLIVNIEKSIAKDDSKKNDNNENINNIYADRKGKISKITVLSGTARKNVGDEINIGELLVEGVMEGKYTGEREVKASAEILVENDIIYERELSFETEIKEKTGNIENKVEIYINNFKINFNKRLLNFENYDTIRENRIVKLFSNYYLPIEIVLTKYEEWKLVKKTYTREELEEILFQEIEEKFKEEYGTSSFEKIDIDKQTKEGNGKLVLTVCYKVQEKIGTKKN